MRLLLHPVLFVLLVFIVRPGASGSAEAALPPDFVDELVTSGLSQPASLAFLPDGRTLVVEQTTGRVRLIVNSVLSGTLALTLPDLNTSGGERGLLGVAVDPRWPAPAHVYLLYTQLGSTMALVRYTATGEITDAAGDSLVLGDRYTLLVDIPDAASNHNAGSLRFGPDDMLYASLGDDADQCAAQDSTDLRGVILRLNVLALPAGSGGPASKALLRPSDNPYPATNANAGLTYAHGLRNPFRFSVDPWSGDLFVGDVGLNAYEELSRVTGGQNLGWPFREGFSTRTTAGCSEPGGSGNYPYHPPLIDYAHAVPATPYSIVAGPLYRPVGGGVHSFPILYSGVVFYIDYYKGFLRALHPVGSTWVPLTVPGQPNATDWGTGYAFIGDFATGPDGAIYYLSQSSGTLRRIRYAGEVNGVEPLPGVALHAFPNPYRAGQGQITVEFPLELEGESAELSIFDALGRRIRSLPTSGSVARWDGRDGYGVAVTPGAYFLRLVTPEGMASRRVVVLP